MVNLKLKALLKILLLMIVGNGCAQENSGDEKPEEVRDSARAGAYKKEKEETKDEHLTHLMDGGQLLVYTPADSSVQKASLIAVTPGNAEVSYDRIMHILKAVEADEEFINLIAPRLKNNRRLKKDSFILPLVDKSGHKHHFEYIADTENRIYTLNYEYRESDP
jgi:hypothetical protein